MLTRTACACADTRREPDGRGTPVELVDSHAHLNHADYDDDRAEVLGRARCEGVVAIVNVGYDLASSARAVEMARWEPDCYAAVGIHPHDATDVDEAALAQLGEWLTEPGVVAVGETGLDFYRDLAPRAAQLTAFRRCLALARERDVPVVLHDRDAHAETLEVLRRDGVPAAGGVMHCFSGDTEMASACVGLGLHVGVTGVITFGKSESLRAAARAVPSERLLIETDCPWLAPEPRRGRRNEPAFVRHVLSALAGALGRPPEDVAEVTSANARRLFRLG